MVETVSVARFCALLPYDSVNGGLPFTVAVSAITLGMSPCVVDAEATARSITCSMSLMVIDAMVWQSLLLPVLFWPFLSRSFLFSLNSFQTLSGKEKYSFFV